MGCCIKEARSSYINKEVEIWEKIGAQDRHRHLLIKNSNQTVNGELRGKSIGIHGGTIGGPIPGDDGERGQ